MPSGVDFDSRCKKYRARLTRRGRVYHLGYFDKRGDALEVRREAEERYTKGLRFKYVHSYTTAAVPVEVEGDPYLFFLASQAQVVPENPERSVRLAVLIQAVKDLLTDTQPAPQADARLWVAGRYESLPGYSFQEIVQFLGLDPLQTRKALRRVCRNKRVALQLIGRRLVRANSGGFEGGNFEG